jgi:hypothetical protein
MRKITRMLLMLLIIVSATKCQKEQSFETGIANPENPKNPITANLQGVVVDENGAPTVGALVIVGTKTATTTANGFFRIKDAALDKSASVVKIEKVGYFVGYRTFMATAGSNHVKVKLVKKQLIGTVNSVSGGAATLANGAKITLQANGIIKKAGGAYTGDVQVYAAYIDPTAADIAETIPGSFMADDKDNKRVLLKSYGMLAVELESASGEKLQIAPGKTAELKTPIPATLSTNSPATIPLWYVDEQTGIWKEQGSASKDGNFYVGNVTHFSFWNCDVPMNAVTLSLKLVTPSGLPIIHQGCFIQSVNNGSGFGYTNSNGIASGLVPANDNLTLNVTGHCSVNIISSQSLGSFSVNTNFGNVIVTGLTNLVEISGNLVNCNGQPVANGDAIISYSWYSSVYISTNSAGNFNYAFVKCFAGPSNLQIVGVDNSTQQQGNLNTFSVNNTNLNVGTIVACGNSSSQFINYNLDGVNYSNTNLVDSSRGQTFTYATTPVLSQTNLYFTSGSNNSEIRLGFVSNNTIGSFTLNNLTVQGTYKNPLPISTVTITNFPVAFPEFYEGSFNASYNDAITPSLVHNINGNFRIRRIN